MKYQLNVLNDSDLEDLAQDLLTRELDLKFHIYKKGRDKGIDLRYSGTRGNKVIVQVKHFINSKVPNLITHLLEVEKPKIKKLRPRPLRYIVFTSLPLSVGNIDTIFAGMSPYIKSKDDIIAGNQVEYLISKYPEVEKKHFKLWLTSTSVLQRILMNAVTGKSEFYQDKIIRNVKLYVPTDNYRTALSKLNKNKFIIISGAPGIGKTTISYLLIYGFLAKGFELVYIEDRIRDGEMQLDRDPKKKQIFYFDDFLGININDILNSKNSQNSIVNFIEHIKHSKNKFLILTTRTTLLKKAEQTYEKFSKSKFSAISKYEVELKQYSLFSKAKILYNHIYYSDVSKKYLDRFFIDRNYLKVIEHRNYAPRLMEFITDSKNLDRTSPKTYWDFVIRNLENPTEIWADAYDNQLTATDRFLLMTLFSLGGSEIRYEHLQTAYDARIKFERDENLVEKQSDSFAKGMRHLLEGLIVSNKDVETGLQTFSLINPSVGDFLLNRLRESKDERKALLNSSFYFDQIANNFHARDIFDHVELKGKELDDFHTVFMSKASAYKFLDHLTKTERAITILKFYFLVFGQLTSESFCNEWMKKISFDALKNTDVSDILYIFRKFSNDENAMAYLDEHASEIAAAVLEACNSADDFLDSMHLFQLNFSWSISDSFLSDDQYTNARIAINKVFSDLIEDDHQLAESRRPEILEDYYNGYHDSAKDTMKLWIDEKYVDFLKESGMIEFQERIKPHLELDYNMLLDKVISDSQVSDEKVSSPLASKKKSVPVLDERAAIVSLFSRRSTEK